MEKLNLRQLHSTLDSQKTDEKGKKKKKHRKSPKSNDINKAQNSIISIIPMHLSGLKLTVKRQRWSD